MRDELKMSYSDSKKAEERLPEIEKEALERLIAAIEKKENQDGNS
ncbi:MAG: hypothetical protein ACFFD4_40710 [Candidatus Odinarchaeota archaeon]